MTADPTPAAALLADLSLVLPDPRPAADLRVRALARGQPLPLDEAVATAARLLATPGTTPATPPAIVGLSTLSIESLRQIIALARAARARLLPDPQLDHPVSAIAPVTQTATLGHLAGADLFVCVGCSIKDLPALFHATPQRVLELPGALDQVIQLRTDCRNPSPQTPAARIRAASSVAALLRADADPRLASQWHKLAAELQQRVRMSVARLPDPRLRNARGVAAVVAWSTGLSCTARGLDFATDPPAPCTSSAGCNVVLDTTASGLDTGARVIAIANAPRPAAELCFITPGLAVGIAARVMRCDGQILWLCTDPAAAPPDPTALLLARIIAAIS